MADLTGLEKVRKACVEAAGQLWCEEHRHGRYWGASPCDSLHPKPEREGWQDYNPMLRDEPAIDDLIERSSFGAPGAKALRRRTPRAVVDEIMRRVRQGGGS